MLKIIKSMRELNTEQLMAVYEQSNREKGQRFFSDLPPDLQLFQAEDAFVSYLREVFFQQNDAFYAVWVVEGIYKSALRMELYKDGLLLEALETATNARRKGYAQQLLMQALDYLRSEGCEVVYSHVDKRNRASLGVHKRCGFQQISDSAVYIDGTVTQSSCTLSINL